MEGSIVSERNGVQLHTRLWLATGTARAMVLLLHGFGEHSGRYNEHAQTFVECGITVFAHDHQGHGLSEGPRADITDFSIYVDDAVQHIQLMSATFAGLSVFVWGQGMGGAVALTLARTHTSLLAGLLLTAPLVMPDPMAATPFKVRLARGLARVRPKFGVGKLDPRSMSSRQSVVDEWEADPLNYHGDLRLRWANVMLRAADDIFAHLNEVTLPFIAVQGLGDDIVVSEGASELYDKCRSRDKTLYLYEGLYHDVCNETETIVQALAKWVLQHCQGEQYEVAHVKFVPAGIATM